MELGQLVFAGYPGLPASGSPTPMGFTTPAVEESPNRMNWAKERTESGAGLRPASTPVEDGRHAQTESRS